MLLMSQYPWWERQRANRAEQESYQARRELEDLKNRLNKLESENSVLKQELEKCKSELQKYEQHHKSKKKVNRK